MKLSQTLQPMAKTAIAEATAKLLLQNLLVISLPGAKFEAIVSLVVFLSLSSTEPKLPIVAKLPIVVYLIESSLESGTLTAVDSC